MVQETECKLNGSSNPEETNVIHGPAAPANEGLRGFGEEIYDRIVLHGNRVSMIDGDTDRSTTFDALRARSAAIALALRARGVTNKDVITLVELTTEDSFAIVLGIIFSGATLGMLDGAWTVPNTASTLLPLYKPRVLFTHVQCLDKVKKVLKDFPEQLGQTELVVYGYENADECQGAVTIDKFVAEYDENDVQNFKPAKVEDTSKTPLLILCTSGSTGVPKGVVHNHKNINDVILAAGALFPQALSLFTNAPCYWTSGIYMFLISLYAGNKKIYTKKPFSELNVLGLVQKYQINALFLSSFQVSLINQHEKTPSYDLSSVYIVLCGGSRLSDGQIAKLQSRLPRGVVLLGYGMTEMCAGVGLNPRDEPKAGSVGKLGSGLSLKVLDLETGQPLGPNQTGEIYMRGPVMLGYYSNQAATDEIIDPKTRWLRTGDIGHYDEEGYIFVTDRLKEIAKYKGLYINPSDIEEILLEHQSVKSACVITVPHDETCDLVVAFAELRTGQESKIQAGDLEKYVNGKQTNSRTV
ncbi:4-coumarate--CoA ligase-like 5 [Ctenocephalides felis]|uniref:4-coumarate--CoA ligase-like 5 n=1 Tax=Ctenocephalides felis TaxID=7515 RepID=UPI000E6E3552|nr:4-coumarate--CoA ligase-like 5 [Ctenocephalides felis]